MQPPLGFLFKQIHDKFERDSHCRSQKQDITMSQSVVLWCLFYHQEEITTQKQLQNHLQLSHPTVIGLLRRLEQKGLVEITVSETDKRCRNVRLTQKALARQAAIQAHREKCEALLKRGMTDEEVQTLRRLLGIVVENLDDLHKLYAPSCTIEKNG